MNMKILFFFFLIGLVINLSAQQKKEYVCLPCGYSSDLEVHSTPGVCSSCNMQLVDKSTITFKNVTMDEFCKRIAANPNALILDV